MAAPVVWTRTRVLAVLALTAGMALTACTGDVQGTPTNVPVASNPPLGPFPSDVAGRLRTEPDILYTETTDCGGSPCRVPGDVIAPAEGSDLPTVVLLGGGATPFEERRYQEDLAVALADRGVVVFLMSYRSAATGNSDNDGHDDVRCAVRYARATTEEFGGDPNRVVVVGHSMGGLISLDIALQPEEDTAGCSADGSGKPDAAVGLGSPQPSFYGIGDSAPPLWVFAGTEDLDAEAMAQRLRDRGFDAQGRNLPGVTHEGITDPAAAPDVVDLILEALSSI